MKPIPPSFWQNRDRKHVPRNVSLRALVFCALALSIGYQLYRRHLPTALFDAAASGDVARIKGLLASGVDPNILRGAGIAPRESPLLVAARAKRWEVVRLLLQSGADPSMQNAFGESALYYAVAYHDIPTIRALLDRHAPVRIIGPMNQPLLLAAIRQGDADSLDLLLSRGGDANSRDNDGNTALIFAANRADMVRALVEHGADVNVRAQAVTLSGPLIMMGEAYAHSRHVPISVAVPWFPRPGYTPLMYAVSAGNIDTVTFLLKHGALPNLIYKELERDRALVRTPLELAIQSDREDIAAVLRHAGAK